MQEENETNYDASKFEKPSVTVDLIVFTIRNEQLYLLLIKRGIACQVWLAMLILVRQFYSKFHRLSKEQRY